MRKNCLKLLLLCIVFVSIGNVCLAEEQPVMGGTVTLGYIDKGEVTELFTFIKENGKDFKLASYQLEKGVVDLKFLAYLDWNSDAKQEARQGKLDKAIEDYTKSIAIYSNAEAYMGRAMAYTSKREFAKAFVDLDKAIAIEPAKGASVAYLRGNVDFAQKEYTQAAVEFDKAIQINPRFTEPYYAKARVLEEEHEYGQAIGEYQEFLKHVATASEFNVFLVQDAKQRIEQLRQKAGQS